MKRFKKYILLFTVGGAGYGLIELIWRGHTHWSMLIAGGVCFILFSLIADKLYTLPLIIKAAVAAAATTAVELLFGLVLNVGLGMAVWDYSNMPLNLFGQICAPFSLLWCALALVFTPLAEMLNEKLNI